MAKKGVVGRAIFIANSRFKSKMKEAIKYSLERSAFAFEIAAKRLITEDNHIITGRYRASINLNSADGLPHTGSGKKSDGIHKFRRNGMALEVGTNVEYAIYLEKRYNIFARAQDESRDIMIKEFENALSSQLK